MTTAGTLEKRQESAIEPTSRLMGPWAELERMREVMSSLFPHRLFTSMTSPDVFSEFTSMPSLNMYKQNGNLVVEAEIPGFDKKDIKVDVTDGVLSISGSRKSEKEEKSEGYFLRERSSGSLSRSVRLPIAIDPNKVKAECRDGVLRIELAMAEPEKHKTVKIAVK
jgi:HSP20 family protein